MSEAISGTRYRSSAAFPDIASLIPATVNLLRGFRSALLGGGFGGVHRLERIGLRPRDEFVGRIHEMDVASDAGRQVRQQIERRAADLFDAHRAAQRRVALLEIEH